MRENLHRARLRQRESRHPMDDAVMKWDLRQALKDEQFEAYLQPIYCLEDRRVAGYEALLRWNHPGRGLLTPYDFIDVAADHDLIAAIDWQMFALGARAFAGKAGDTEYLSLNVSASHLTRDDFTPRLIELLATCKLSPRRVLVELTEDVFVDDPERVRETLLSLREAGVRTALDDFGTGYSSLHSLHALPIDILKIDRAFVERVASGQDGNGTAVVAAILTLARVFGIDVIAEGIETEAQAEQLRVMGCRYGQGFLFGRPQPAQAS
jgi:EAL domain-containing protein (putative c-di-GMP-specific phosphodiesterase class I)